MRGDGEAKEKVVPDSEEGGLRRSQPARTNTTPEPGTTDENQGALKNTQERETI